MANDGASTLYKKDSNGLSIISIGKNVKSIGDGAFRNNRALESVVVPDSVEFIGFGAFDGCSSLETMVLPFIGGAVSYDMSASDSPYFAYIFGADRWNETLSSYDSKVPSSLKKVTILTSNLYEESDCVNSIMVPHIPAMAFAQCSSIEELNLPNDYEEIYDYAFYGCSSLESFVFSNKCLAAGNYAFANCSSLQYIYIPETIETGNLISLYGGIISLYLGDYAFANCTSLKTVYIPNGIPTPNLSCSDDRLKKWG